MAVALVSIALERITDALQQRVELFVGATGELKKLSSTFRSIQAVLRDAENRQITEESVRVWLSELKKVAYDIDDLLDEQLILGLENEGGHEHGHIGNKALAMLGKLLSKLLACGSRYELAYEIKEIRERLNQIADDKDKYRFNISGCSSGGYGMHAGGSRLPTTSLQDSSEVIGRENDKEILITQLLSGGSSTYEGNGQVPVIAIVGIGGLGKTTLAREIHNHRTAKAHFNKKLWVCVTENFDLVRVTKAILEDLEGESTSVSQLNTLQMKLRTALEGKRFLLVLDDMWNDDEGNWKALRLSLTSGAAGSRILVTTRREKVARTVNAAYIHELEGLSDDDCWELFSRKAFAGRTEENRLKLEGIGKKIVKRCNGVPLSVKVMGSAMHSKRTVEDWKNIFDSEIWSLPEATNEILPALLLSYSNLPSHLKQCFAYCSMYEKDVTMVKDDLVRLWMAQGFIQLQGNRDMEDIGGEYFDDLVALSMFQEVEESEYETKCKMHDLLHDLAQFIMKDETGIFVRGRSDQSSIHVRHASLFFPRSEASSPFAFDRPEKLRTLFLNDIDEADPILVDLFRQASVVRALNVRFCSLGFEKAVLPETIGKLKHLRYLDLSCSGIVQLPESVTHILVLQTLKLSSCKRLQRLPTGMGRMVGLRHLEIEGTDGLKCLPKGLGRITSLRSLSKFIVAGEGGCGIDELQRLNSLRGHLEIQRLERVSSREEAEKAELWNKPYLRTLRLSMSDGYRDTERMGDVLEGLKPHQYLEELTVCSKFPYWIEEGSWLAKFPSWIEEGLSLPNLIKLEIRGFTRCAQLPGLGKLAALKHLVIVKVGIRKLGHEFYFGNSSGCYDVRRRGAAFPKLEQLKLDSLSKFVEWELPSEHDAEIMPSLHALELRRCSKLKKLPHHLSKIPLKNLEIVDCEKIEGTGCCFPLLEKFRLRYSGKFFSGGLPNIPNARIFRISRISNETLPNKGWEQLHLLEVLRLNGCRKLQCLPDGLGQLKRLKSLEIYDSEKLTCMPNGLGQLESLQTLAIKGCRKLESLPDGMGQLKALRFLFIQECEVLGSLPEGLQGLPLLQRVQITDCPLLSERYRGEGWLKIVNRDPLDRTIQNIFFRMDD